MAESPRLLKDMLDGIQSYNQVYDFQADPIWFLIACYLDLEP